AGLHHSVVPLSGLNAVNLVKRILRERRYLKIFLCVSFGFRSSQQSSPTLYRPCQHDLRWRLSYSLRHSHDDGVCEWAGLYSMTQGRKGQQYNPFFFAEFKEVCL